MVNKLVYLANKTRPDNTMRRADYGVQASPVFGFYQHMTGTTMFEDWFLEKNGGFGGKVYNHPDSSIADGKSIGIHSSEALNVEQIQPGFELIFKGVKYQFGRPFNKQWNRFQSEWERVMETRREFLDTCALNNNAVRPNVSRRVVSTPNGIKSIPSAAAQASPYRSLFNFEYKE